MFALAVQMLLSFGHMHRDDLGLAPLRTPNGTQFTSDAARASAQPADQRHHPASKDYCPICASMELVATALPSLPPVLVEPVSMRPVLLSQTPVRWPSAQVRHSFQARAPPLA
jgi:hypothetical protein